MVVVLSVASASSVIDRPAHVSADLSVYGVFSARHQSLFMLISIASLASGSEADNRSECRVNFSSCLELLLLRVGCFSKSLCLAATLSTFLEPALFAFSPAGNASNAFLGVPGFDAELQRRCSVCFGLPGMSSLVQPLVLGLRSAVNARPDFPRNF